MKKNKFSVAAISGLVLALGISAPLAGAAPQNPENVKPSDYAKDVGLNPVLEAKVTDSAGATIETVEFLKGYTYDFSGSGAITGYQQVTQENPLTGPALQGANPFSADDGKAAASSDSKAVLTASKEGFPTQRFEVDVAAQLETGSEVELQWEGYSPKGGVITLSAWDHQLGIWEVLKQGEADGDKIELAADIEQTKFIKNGKIQAMVHDSRTAPVPENDIFTMMWFTDTQFYTQDNPEVWDSMTDWMIEEYQKGTYEYAFHTGDLVQTVTKEEEWAIADKNLDRMDAANIPYGVIAGNHDVVINTDPAGIKTYDYAYYWKYAGADRFEGKPWYGGQMDNNRNHYDLYSFDGHDFIMLYLGYGMEGTPETIKWANDVLKKYADRNAIMAIHLNLTPEKTHGNGPSYNAYHKIVVPNENVKMVLSGHYQGAAHRVQTIKNPDGTEREVLEVLSNYQGGTKPAQRGQGYLRLLNFNPADESVSFVTYSPYLDDYDFFDPAEDSFKANYDLNEADASAVKAAPVERQVETDYFAVNIYKKQQIGQKDKIKSGDAASVQWSGLKPSTQYFWYLKSANAAAEVNRSEMYRFTTGKLTEPVPVTPSFKDVTSEFWAFKEIEEMAAKGVIIGHTDSTFRPQESIERQHVALMFSRSPSLDLSIKQDFVAFSDVPTSHKYFKEIKTVQQADIFIGYGDEFKPFGKLTRAEMAKVLVEAFDIEIEGQHNFPDVPKGHWANSYISTLYATELTNGISGEYRPEEEVTRAQFATFMSRALEKYGLKE